MFTPPNEFPSENFHIRVKNLAEWRNIRSYFHSKNCSWSSGNNLEEYEPNIFQEADL